MLRTAEELSEQIQVPVRTLGQWRYLRKGPAWVEVGRHRRYRQEDIDAWIEAHRHDGSAA